MGCNDVEKYLSIFCLVIHNSYNIFKMFYVEVLTVFNLIGCKFLDLTDFRGKAKTSSFFPQWVNFWKVEKSLQKRKSLCSVWNHCCLWNWANNSKNNNEKPSHLQYLNEVFSNLKCKCSDWPKRNTSVWGLNIRKKLKVFQLKSLML